MNALQSAFRIADSFKHHVHPVKSRADTERFE
jgi:hypothetical protein